MRFGEDGVRVVGDGDWGEEVGVGRLGERGCELLVAAGLGL